MIYVDWLIIIFHHCYNLNLKKNFPLTTNTMLYIPKIGYYLEILTDKEAKDFVALNFSEYLKSTKEKLYSNLNEE